MSRDAEVVGILHGWRGMIEGVFCPLDGEAISGILPRGGTIIRTSRTNPYKVEGGIEKVRENLKRFDGVVASAARTRSAWPPGCSPRRARRWSASRRRSTTTSSATDYTFGFDTAVQIVTEAIDRLHTTAESHNRVMVVEVMGRHVGWIAVDSGIAGGADVVLIPEHPLVGGALLRADPAAPPRGKDFSIVVVGEGTADLRVGGRRRRRSTEQLDEFGHIRLGGVGERLGRRDRAAHRLRDPGHDARPRAARRLPDGLRPRAGDALRPARRRPGAGRQFGQMAALRGSAIVPVPLADAVSELKAVPQELLDLAATFFG